MRRAQQDSTRRRRSAPAALGLGIAALLTVAACGSGQLAQTAQMAPAVNGGIGQAGKVAVRNAMVAFPETGRSYPAGSDVPLVATIVNSGPTADTLVSVTSEVSGPAVLEGSKDLPPGARLVVGEDLIDRPSASVAPETTESSSPATTTTGASGSSSASATTTTTVASTTEVTATSPAEPAVGKVSVMLKGLKTPVQPGQSILITFTFAHAGSVTVSVPVAAPGGTPTQAPNPTPSE